MLIQEFSRYVGDVAGVHTAPVPRPPVGLPQFLRQRYDLWRMHITGEEVTGLVIRDPPQFTPAAFEKHLRLLPPDVRQAYVLIAGTLASYVRHRLVERGVPFVVPGVQMYWPHLGVVVRARNGRNPIAVHDQISPATQAVIIGALAGAVPADITATGAAQRLGYTPMTMTRAFDELEATGLAETERRKHVRHLRFTHRGKQLWQTARTKLRNPVRKTVRLRTEDIASDQPLLAGESALAALTMLVAPANTVYAVGPAGWAAIRARRPEIVPVDDDDTSAVQIWAYDPAVAGKDGRVDPFSLALTLQNTGDERIASAIDEMMEQVTW